MEHCRTALLATGWELRYTIHDDDFILGTRGRPDQRTLFDDDGAEDEFDAVIMNPPYFKIGADSSHALAMGEAFRGNTNIYMLFMARAAELLRPGGEMVAITPRSFCNGLYFRNFRRWFFSRMGLRHIHLFECRRSTFDDVLQESIITLTERSGGLPRPRRRSRPARAGTSRRSRSSCPCRHRGCWMTAPATWSCASRRRPRS